MGTPTQQTWPEGLKLAAAMNFRFPQFAPTPISKLIPHACPEACDLITMMCAWDPNKRPTAVQCLQVRGVWGGGWRGRSGRERPGREAQRGNAGRQGSEREMQSSPQNPTLCPHSLSLIHTLSLSLSSRNPQHPYFAIGTKPSIPMAPSSAGTAGLPAGMHSSSHQEVKGSLDMCLENECMPAWSLPCSSPPPLTPTGLFPFLSLPAEHRPSSHSLIGPSKDKDTQLEDRNGLNKLRQWADTAPPRGSDRGDQVGRRRKRRGKKRKTRRKRKRRWS
jgi:hypothetical protein